MICTHSACGREWTPRKPNPTKCPSCQNPLWRSSDPSGVIYATQAPAKRTHVARVVVATTAQAPGAPAPPTLRTGKRRRAVCRYNRENRSKLKQKLAYYGWRCRYCRVEFSPEVELTWDHAIPVSRGGCDAIANLLPSCKSCNGRKYNRTIVEFLELVVVE